MDGKRAKYVHEWRDKHVQLIEENKHKLWFWVLEFNLHLHDFDPYAIFKCDQIRKPSLDLCFNKIRKYSWQKQRHQKIIDQQHHDRSLYRSKELQLRHTRRDEFRQRSTRPLKLFAAYFIIKAFVISLAHHTLMRYEYLVPKNLSRPLMSLDYAQLIARHLGIPFYALKDISLTLFFTATCFAFICVVALPMYQRKHPVNIASLRFVLDPQLELRRVDASIRRKLSSLKCSLQVYELQQADQYRRAASQSRVPDHLAPRLELLNSFSELTASHRRRAKTLQSSNGWPGRGNQVWLNELKRRELHYCRKIETYLNELGADPHERESLRPSTFEPDYFASMTALVEQVVLSTHANYLCVWLVITSSLIYFAYSNRCPRLDCDPLRAFSGPEMLAAAEAQTILAITCFSCSLNFTLLALLNSSQLEIIKSIEQELLACQRAISSFIYVERSSRSPLMQPGQHKLAGVIIQINDFSHIDTLRDELERLLLKSITRLAVCDRELKDNARCISEQTVHPACYMGSALFLAALNVQFKLPDSNFLRSFVVGVIWLSVNMVAVLCANIHARVLGLQRNLWSILALSSQLLQDNYYMRFDLERPPARYTAFDDLSGPSSLGIESGEFISIGRLARWRDGATGRAKGKCCTFVADLWLKFVYSTSANIDQHCSRLLSMELSYQNIIEANFFSIFIYSLTLAYDR